MPARPTRIKCVPGSDYVPKERSDLNPEDFYSRLSGRAHPLRLGRGPPWGFCLRFRSGEPSLRASPSGGFSMLVWPQRKCSACGTSRFEFRDLVACTKFPSPGLASFSIYIF
jgi:hypothetical protein